MTDTTPTRAATRLPREIWVLMGASFLIAVGYGLVAPALPSFAKSFQVSVTAASVVISAFAFVRLVFAPASGRLATRFGERPIYLWGLTIVAVGTLACATATNYWQLLLYRSASGIGSTMYTVSAIGLLIRISPAELRGRVSSLWSTSFLLGGIAGPVLGSGLVTVSLRAPFVAYGGAVMVTTALVWSQLRGSALADRSTADAAPPLTFRQAIGHRTYRAALMSNFANGWLVFGVRMSLMPLFVTSVLGRTDAFAGIALAVFAASNALVLLISGRYVDDNGRWPPAVVGLAMLTVGTVALGVVDDSWLLLGAMAVAGAGSGALNPAHNAAVADVVGSRARGGSVLAGFQMAADVGAVVGPMAAGAAAQQWSYSSAFVLTGAVSAVAFTVWLTAFETHPGRTATDDDVAVCRSG